MTGVNTRRGVVHGVHAGVTLSDEEADVEFGAGRSPARVRSWPMDGEPLR